MSPLLLFFVFAISAGPLLSADELQIDPYEAPSHIGQSVSVSGVVALFKSKRGKVFINFGGKYTNQTFTGWIPSGTPHCESSLAEDAPRQDGQDHWRDRALPREARDQNHLKGPDRFGVVVCHGFCSPRSCSCALARRCKAKSFGAFS
jgi:hypothetical protein